MADEKFIIEVILKARDQMATAFARANTEMGKFRKGMDSTKKSMGDFDKSSDRTEKNLNKLSGRLGETTRRFAVFRKGTDDSSRSLRFFNNTLQRSENYLRSHKRGLDQNRESIAKFDNEIRGMRVLVIAAQMQALASAVVGLGGALAGVAGSAVTAGAALGGALTAGAAQAIPVIGLLAASVARLKAAFDVASQIQKAQQAEATQATSAQNKQADGVDKLATAHNGLRDAQQRVIEAQKGVTQARIDDRRALQDLILAERGAALQQEESQNRLRQMRAQGITGTALRGAQLDVDEARVGARRATQDLATARTTPENTQQALRQLRDAQEALATSRRGMASARRDVAEGGATSVAAARTLDYLQSQLTNSERKLVKSLINLRDTYKRVSRPITDTIVESFTRAVDRSEQVIQRPSFINAFQRLADSASKQFDRITNSLTSDRSIAFYERMTKEAATNLQPATTASIRMSRAFQNIADAAAPTVREMFRDIARGAKSFEEITENETGLRRLFENGHTQLHAWWQLTKSIGATIKALIAPGGDLQSGAAASGLRSIVRLTERFQNAAEWLNEHPMQVNEFFGESEQTLERILDLLLKIAATMLQVFDPESVDAFADIFENLLPAIEVAAEFFGTITKFFAFLIQTPGIREMIQGAFGFLLISRIGDKFIGFITVIRSALAGALINTTRWAQAMGRVNTSLGAARVATGGLLAQIRAGTVAWNTYGTAAARANAVARGGAVVGPAGRPLPPRGPDGRFLPRGTTAGGGVAGGLGRLGGLGGAGGALLGGARFVGGLAAFTAVLTVLTGHGGPMERFGQALESATFGLIKAPTRQSAVDTQRDRNRAAGDPNAFILGGGRENRGIREAIRDNDIEKLRHFRRELRLTREEAVRFGDEDGAAQAAKQIKAINRALDEGVGVSNKPLFKQALDRIKELNTTGAQSLKELRDNMRITSNFIGDAAEKGSKHWREAMILNTQAGVDQTLKLLNRNVIGADEAFSQIARISRRQMRLMRNNMADLSADARDRLSENFRTARIRAERQLGTLEEATGDSLRTIRRLMRAELASYGFSDEEIRSIIRTKRNPDDNIGRGSKAFEGGSSGPVQRASGGYIGSAGERGRDGIRTVLGAGEAVLNWGQQKLVEPALNAAYGFGLGGLFKRTKGFHAGGHGAPGFARGGIPIVPVPGFPGEMANRSILDEIAFFTKRFGLRLTDAYGQGHQSPGHTTFGTAADLSGPDRAMDAAVKNLVRRGYKVLYDGRFGSTAWPGHGPSTVAGSNAHLHVEFGSKSGSYPSQVASRVNVPKVEIVGGGIAGEIANAAVRATRTGAIRAAKQAVRRMGGAGTEGAESGAGPAPPGQLRSWLRRALSITNLLNPGNLNALYGRAMQESGGNPRAINNWDSNAAAGNNSRGLLQTIPSTFAAYKLPRMGNIYNPIHNAVAAIRYMMARYGHIVGPSSTGYAKGGELPGPHGQAQWIMAHGKEWILNDKQKGAVARMVGTSVDKLKGMLGFAGGPGTYQGGGEPGDKKIPGYQPPEGLDPLDFGGVRREVRRFFNAIRKISKAGQFKRINDELDAITEENGLLDQLAVSVERRVADMATRSGLRSFRRGNVVRRRTSDAFDARADLNALRFTGTGFRTGISAANRGIGLVNRTIRGLRQDGLTDAEQNQVDNLLVQRRNLSERRRGLRGSLAENLRARFEAQQRVIETALEKSLRGNTAATQINSLAQRVAQTFGRGGQAGLIDIQAQLLRDQIPLIQKALTRATRQGNTALADQLRGQLLEIDGQLAELVVARLQAQMDDANKAFARRESVINFFDRMAQATGRFGLGATTALTSARGGLLQDKLASATAFRDQASRDGNTAAVDELNQTILDLNVEIAENSRTLREARIAETNRLFDRARTGADRTGRIADARVQLGQITPEEARQIKIAANQSVATALGIQAADFQQQLLEAIRVGDTDEIERLNDALADNALAVLENSVALHELNGSVTDTANWSSSAWQLFRTAIFNGSGGILPQFDMPLGSTGIGGGSLTGAMRPPGWVGNSGAGGGTVVDVDIHEAGNTPDPIYLANRVAWALNTPAN